MNSAGSAVSQELQTSLGISVVQHDCARLRFAPSPTGYIDKKIHAVIAIPACCFAALLCKHVTSNLMIEGLTSQARCTWEAREPRFTTGLPQGSTMESSSCESRTQACVPSLTAPHSAPAPPPPPIPPTTQHPLTLPPPIPTP